MKMFLHSYGQGDGGHMDNGQRRTGGGDLKWPNLSERTLWMNPIANK